MEPTGVIPRTPDPKAHSSNAVDFSSPRSAVTRIPFCACEYSNRRPFFSWTVWPASFVAIGLCAIGESAFA
jgi:hypothetical protein